MKNRTRPQGARLTLTPVAVALLCVFPACAQAATSLPAFKVDPALLNPPAAGTVQPYNQDGGAPAATAPAQTEKPAEQPQTEAPPPPPKKKPKAAKTKPMTERTAAPADTAPAATAPAQASAAATATPALPARRPEDDAKPEERPSPALSTPPAVTSTAPEDQPVYISAEHIQGHEDAEVEAEGKAELIKADQTIRGDYLTYFKPEDEVYAKGNVSLEQKGDAAEGPEMRLKLDKHEGYMETPSYRFAEGGGHGNASQMQFKGQDKFGLDDATYSTCPVGNNDWYMRAKKLDLDRTVNEGIAHDTTVYFKDTPILYAPWMTFPIKKERKSGFLSPTFGTTGKNGAEFSLPYYWNIAPNYDATITPKVMGKRGVQLGAEFRYLQPDYVGQISYETIPDDRIRGDSRYAFNWQHTETFGHGWSGGLNIQKVSDADYFTDLTTTLALTSLANLPREGYLSYNGGWWNATGRVQKWQFLSTSPVVSRTPQLTLNAGRQLYGSPDGRYALNFGFDGEYVNFTSNPLLPDVRRTVLHPSLSLPITAVYGYVTPKFSVHSARYSFDHADPTAPADVSVTVPVVSVDSGLTFERDTEWFGNAFQQTLEPRAYYVYAPYRDQSTLPLYDTGDFGFGLPQIFSDNRFVGNDRISDANQVTLGVTTRFLEPNGTERLRATVAQRYYFTLPRVTLPGQTPPDRKMSDLLAQVGGQISKDWWLDSFWQYNPDLSRTEIFNVGARYKPEPGKILNASFRYTPTPTATVLGTNPNGFRQIDVSAQWPIYGRWSGVGRWNYSILDKTTLEGVAGLEYDGGCWATRFVLHSLTTGPNQKTNAFFIQLELNGLARVGSNPLDILKENIFGYTKINEQ